MEQGPNPYNREGAFDPESYPRTYRELPIFGLMYGVISTILLVAALLIAYAGLARHKPENFLYALLTVAYALYQARCALNQSQVELTATSLMVTSRFSQTRSIQREDITRCDLQFLRGACITIEYREPAGELSLNRLDWDDAFWDWFSGIPGRRVRPG